MLTNAQMVAGRFLKYAEARARLAWIKSELSRGRDVYVCTYTKATRITPKNFAKWEREGATMFKAVKSGLYIARGKSWDCIDGCKLVAR